MGTHDQLRSHFRDAFAADPLGAYRDWFRAQEELRDGTDGDAARALADDLWEMLPGLVLGPPEARARFFHNAAVFFGSPGPAADLFRAREAFTESLAHFSSHSDSGWHARALHNFATALSNLGTTEADLRESVSLFERALEWRTSERESAARTTPGPASPPIASIETVNSRATEILSGRFALQAGVWG